MKQFDIMTRSAHDVVAVKRGVTWWGFIFPIPWLLIKRLWLAAAIAIAACFGFQYFFEYVFGDNFTVFVALGLSVAVWKCGNQLVFDNLIRKGYFKFVTVAARNAKEALSK